MFIPGNRRETNYSFILNLNSQVENSMKELQHDCAFQTKQEFLGFNSARISYERAI